jgi:parallel beta-helix repeat protein
VINSAGVYVLQNDITGSSNSACIDITSDDVFFDGQGYTIDGIDGGSSKGIYAHGTGGSHLVNITIVNVTLTDWDYGIHISYVDNSTVANNTANSNLNTGIYLYLSSSNSIENNDAKTNTYGIYLSGNLGDGDGGDEIFVSYNNITGNNASENSHSGIYLLSEDNTRIWDNFMLNNQYGVYLTGLSCSNNLIYNNYIAGNSNSNAYDGSAGPTYWNTTKTGGTNIVRGPWIGGNYWGDYTGNDTDGDGLGDTQLPYNSSGNIASGGDYLPLISDLTNPLISFVSPTPANATITASTSVAINVTITEAYLEEVIFNWDGTNYTLYNDSLVLMMNFDNLSALGEGYSASDSTVKDLSQAGNDGTTKNGLGASVVAGRHGSALDFDGTDDYVEVPDSSSLDLTDNFAVEAWIRPEGFNVLAGIVSKYHTLSSHGFVFRLGPTTPYNRIDFCGFEGSVNLTAGNWYHVVGVMDSGTTKIYINGELDSSGSPSYTLSANSDPVRIGVDYLAIPRYFNGTIDEVRIWNRVLSAGEIREHYYSNLQKYDTDKWLLYVNQSGLTDGTYTYQAHALDAYGNGDATDQRSITVDTTPPAITFVSPTPSGGTAVSARDSVTINVTLSETGTAWLEWDGTNESMVGGGTVWYLSKQNIPVGSHTYRVWANDSAGNINVSETRTLTVRPVEVSLSTDAGQVEMATVTTGCFAHCATVNVSDLPSAGRPDDIFPCGMFNFTIEGLTPGQNVTLTLTLPANLPQTAQYWKYDAINGWYQLPLGSNDGDNVITITLTDGGIGDSDGLANGVISDPGGPGLPSSAVPALTPLGAALLAGLGGALGIRRVKRKGG